MVRGVDVKLEKGDTYENCRDDDRCPPWCPAVYVDVFEYVLYEGCRTPAVIKTEGFKIANLFRDCKKSRRVGPIEIDGPVIDRELGN